MFIMKILLISSITLIFHQKRIAQYSKPLLKVIKISVKSPILVNNTFVTSFNNNTNIFNDFFKCQPIPNNSTLPSVQF